MQSKAGGGEKSSGGDKKAPNIIIENLYLRDSSVAVIAPLLNEKLSVPLPTIHLTDIGREGKGATPEVTTRAATRAWECGGAMLWRLDENAVGIVDERAAAAAQGGDMGAGGKAVGA